MTSYHVLIADDLAAMITADPGRLPGYLRLVQQEPTDPGSYAGMHWWLVEDDEADPSLEGKRVELTFTRGRKTEDGFEPDLLTERRVLP